MAIFSPSSNWRAGLDLVFQISGWLVGPIVLAIFLGKWLDNKLATGQLWFFICIGVAFVVTNLGLILETIKFAKKLDGLTKKSNESKPDRPT